MAGPGPSRNMTWGTAIAAAFALTFGIIILFGIAPSQFITTVNKSYGRVPYSGQSRFIRDLISGGYHMVVLVWLGIGAYQIQRLARRSWRLAAFGVLFGVPIVLFALAPGVLHGFINHYVSTRPEERKTSTLYTLDEWIYTMYWAATIGFIQLATPAWIIGLKKLEERFGGAARAARTSAFGRPVVTPT